MDFCLRVAWDKDGGIFTQVVKRSVKRSNALFSDATASASAPPPPPLAAAADIFFRVLACGAINGVSVLLHHSPHQDAARQNVRQFAAHLDALAAGGAGRFHDPHVAREPALADSPSMLACGHTETSRSTVCEATDTHRADWHFFVTSSSPSPSSKKTTTMRGGRILVANCAARSWWWAAFRTTCPTRAPPPPPPRQKRRRGRGRRRGCRSALCGSATTARGPIASFHVKGWPCFGRRRAVAKGARSAHKARRFCSSFTAPKLWPPPPPRGRPAASSVSTYTPCVDQRP